MGKYKTLGVNSLYTFIGQVGGKVISLIMLPFYTHWLSVEDYGIGDIVNVYASLIVCIATLSMHEAIFVFPVNQSLEKQKEYYSTAFISSCISIIGVIFICLFLKVIGKFYGIDNSFFNNIGFVVVLFVSVYLQNFSQQFCRSINKMAFFCISGLLVTVFTAILAFLMIPRYGLYGFIYSQALANIIGMLFAFIFAKEYRFFSFKSVNKICWKEMIKFSIPLIPNATLWWIISALNRPVMESALGVTSIGLFSVANRFPGVVSMVMSIFSNSWQLSVLQEYGKKDFNAFFSNISKMYIPIAILVSTLIALFSRQIFVLLVDDKFYEAWVYAPMMALAVIGTSASGFYGSVFSAVKQSKYYLYSSIVGGGGNYIIKCDSDSCYWNLGRSTELYDISLRNMFCAYILCVKIY